VHFCLIVDVPGFKFQAQKNLQHGFRFFQGFFLPVLVWYWLLNMYWSIPGMGFFPSYQAGTGIHTRHRPIYQTNPGFDIRVLTAVQSVIVPSKTMCNLVY